MKKFLKVVSEVLLGIWQLPQSIIGGILLLVYNDAKKMTVDNECIFYSDSFRGGISLGHIIIVGNKSELTAKHELGHRIQSKILGPLYLFVIGIPSFTWACLYGSVIKSSNNGYYKFYTEKWADKLAGIQR